MPPELAGTPPPAAGHPVLLPPHWQQHDGPAPAAEGSVGGPTVVGEESSYYSTFVGGGALAGGQHPLGGGLAPERAAALFRAYDLMGRGWLTRTQMVQALSELSVVHGLGEKGLNQVLGQDPATSREAKYSLQDFLSMYERIGLYQAKAARGERIRALSAISEPPAGALTSPALRAVFSAYCRYAVGTSRLLMAQEGQGEQRMNAQQLVRLCQDLELLSAPPPAAATTGHQGPAEGPGATASGPASPQHQQSAHHAPLTFAMVDVVFAKCKQQQGGGGAGTTTTTTTSRRLGYPQWLRALAALSDAAGRDLFAQITAHALHLQPQLAQHADAGAVLAAPGPGHLARRSVPASRERTGAAGSGGGLPRLRTSVDSGTVVAARQAPPGAPPAQAGALVPPASGRLPAPPAHLPGRLSVLERAILEDAARAAGGQAGQGKGRDASPPLGQQASAASLRHSHGQLPPRGALRSAGDASGKALPEAWPEARPGGAAGGALSAEASAGPEVPEGAGAETVLPPVGQGRARDVSPSLPSRPRTEGQSRAAGVATEVWRFRGGAAGWADGAPGASDSNKPPAWAAQVLQRLQDLESREQVHKCELDEARADLVVRTQKWEQAERLVSTKASSLEARVAAVEARTGEAGQQLGELRAHVDGLWEHIRHEVVQAQQSIQAQVAQLTASLDGKVQAALAAAQEASDKATAAATAAAAAAAAAASQQPAAASGVSAEVAAHVEASVNGVAEHLARELGLAAAQQTASATAPLGAAVDGLQAAHQALGSKLDQLAAALAEQQAQAERLKAELQEAKARQAEPPAPSTRAAPADGVTPAQLTELREAVAAVEAKLGQRVDQATAKLAELQQAQAQAAAAAAAPAQPAPGQQAQLAELAASQGALTTQVEELRAQIAQVLAAPAASAAPATTPEAAVAAPAPAAPDASLAEVHSKLADLSAALEELRRNSTQPPAPSPSEAHMGSGKADEAQQRLDSRLAELEKTLGALTGQVGSAGAAAAALEGVSKEVAVLDARVGQAQAAATEAAAAASQSKEAAAQEAAALQQAVSGLEARTKEVEGKVAAAAAASSAAPPPSPQADKSAAAAAAVAQAAVTEASRRWESSAKQLHEAVRALEDKLAEAERTGKQAADATAASLAHQVAEAEQKLEQRLAALETRQQESAAAAAASSADASQAQQALLERLGGVEGLMAQLGEAVRAADAAAAAVGAQASAAQASASEALRLGTEASGKAAALEQRAAALEASLQQQQQRAQSASPGAAEGTADKLNLVEAAVVQAASKIEALEAGVAALANAALGPQQPQQAPSGPPSLASMPDVSPAGAGLAHEELQALLGRLAALEATVVAGATPAADTTPRGGAAAADATAPGAVGRSTSTKGGDVEALGARVTQLSNVLLDVQRKLAVFAGAGGVQLEAAGAAGAGAAATALPPGYSAAAMTALQLAQMQTVQQLRLQQGAIAQIANKLVGLEAKVALAVVGGGAGGGGSGSLVTEMQQQQQASQMSLLQGAIVQLSGEVNSLKLAVPQLTSALKGANGGKDAASVTASVASGQYGPVLAALAEELQRCAVRAGSLESDVRLSLTSLAKASDLAQLHTLFSARAAAVEQAVEELRSSVRGIADGSGGLASGPERSGRSGGALMTRMSHAAPPLSPPTNLLGGGGGAEAGAHRFATWDALKHAEGMLIKSQQQSKEELVQVNKVVGELLQRVAATDDKFTQQLNGKEKILMRMAKEVDELKATVAALPRHALASAALETTKSGPAKSLATSKSVAKSSRHSMFDD